MPKCKKCESYFPNKTTIDNKELYLNKRSYCLSCSPFGEKNGYKIRKEFTGKGGGSLYIVDATLPLWAV